VAAALLAGCLIWALPVATQEMSLTGQVIERVLPNGLKVLMVKRPEAPLIRCILAYRVGSVNERPGITGISRFHEHMMFRAQDPVSEPGTGQGRQCDRQIDALEAKVVEEESKVTGRDDARIMA
jgi:predicted Zn-dependent peptidase